MDATHRRSESFAVNLKMLRAELQSVSDLERELGKVQLAAWSAGCRRTTQAVSAFVPVTGDGRVL